jgi:hypothetical protein
VLSSTRVTEEVFGFHCQQAVEKLLKAVRRQETLGAIRRLRAHVETVLTECSSPAAPKGGSRS